MMMRHQKRSSTVENPSFSKRFTVSGAALLAVGMMTSACSSSSGLSSDISAYASMNCTELNERIQAVSQEISRRAIDRGKVENNNIPSWIPGTQKLTTTVVDRQSERIENLQEHQRALSSLRSGNCQ